MDFISIFLRGVSGIASLFFGRRIFWLFAALVGFMAGFILGGTILPDATMLVKVLTGLGVGLLGAILSRFFPTFIAAAIGFFALGGVLMNQLDALTPLGSVLKMVVFLVGGIVGVYLAVNLFDLALVLLSSLTGAGTLAALGNEILKFGGSVQTIVFVVLLVVGILFQLLAVKPAATSPVKPSV